MYNVILTGVLAFIITFFSIPVIIQVARQKKMFDEPDDRKVHKMVIPTLGGLGIFAGFILAVLLGVPILNPELQYFMAAIIVIFFLGIKDDILVLSPTKKFLGQLLAAGILIKFAGVRITNMYGFLGINELPPIASLALTAFAIVVITNSFNLIDGVDGLAGSLGLFSSAAFGIYFILAGQLMFAVIGFALVGSLSAFLIYNFSPAKIFMGDTGSLLIGLANSIMVIKFINLAGSSASSVFYLPSAPAIGFSILIVPLFDTLRVFALRILDSRSPFSPDQIHIHHFLLDLGFSHRKITVTCLVVSVFFIGISYALKSLGTTLLLAILLLFAMLLIGVVYYFRSKKYKPGKTFTDMERHQKANRIYAFETNASKAE